MTRSKINVHFIRRKVGGARDVSEEDVTFDFQQKISSYHIRETLAIEYLSFVIGTNGCVSGDFLLKIDK